MYLVRDQTCSKCTGTLYSGSWKNGGSNWNAAYRAQVPFGVDIDHADTIAQGIFAMPHTALATGAGVEYNCFTESFIAHISDSQNYEAYWYDVLASDDLPKTYIFNPTTKYGHLYFSVESYYYDLSVGSCNVAPASTGEGSTPKVFFEVA